MEKWSNKERDFLIEECRRGDLTVKQMAARLRRSYMSVAGMLREMGLRVASKPRFWTAELDARLARFIAAGASKREICRRLNTSASALETRATRLGLALPAPRAPSARGAHCKVCFIGAEFMAGCPRETCEHYGAPEICRERTLGGVAW